MSHLSMGRLRGVGRAEPARQAAAALLMLASALSTTVRAETFAVTSLANSGPGSLRAAVALANANPGPDTVVFRLSGLIELSAPLEVSDDLRIDGMDQQVTLSGGDRVTLLVLNDPSKSLDVARLTLANASYSQSSGGAIHSRGSLRLLETLFVDNVAPVGGAVFSSGPSLQVVNSTFANNRALAWGGAIAVGPGTRATITHSTFVTNDAAQFGGALFQNPIVANSSYTGSIVVRNSLISGVTTQGNCSVISNKLVDGGGNLNSDGSCPFNVAKGSANHTNPMLGPLAQHGGPTRSFAPLPGSPAIDSGIDALAQSSDGSSLMTDQRGYRRQAGLRVDRGAFEVQARERTAATDTRAATLAP
jgi:large repetitive protein